MLAWVLAILGLLSYEGYTLLNAIPGDTLSEAVWAVSMDYPLLPFLAGILCGHFFWQRKQSGTKIEADVVVLATGNQQSGEGENSVR